MGAKRPKSLVILKIDKKEVLFLEICLFFKKFSISLWPGSGSIYFQGMADPGSWSGIADSGSGSVSKYNKSVAMDYYRLQPTISWWKKTLLKKRRTN